MEDFITETESAGLTHLASVTGEIDLSTQDGRLHARLLGSIARYESEHKSFRIKRKHEDLAAKAKVSGGGDRPFGFEDDRVTIRQSEARLIRDAARRVLTGDSLRSIAKEWNENGIRTATSDEKDSGIWYTSALSRVLRSARIRLAVAGSTTTRSWRRPSGPPSSTRRRATGSARS